MTVVLSIVRCSDHRPVLHSFPTRRSSDLAAPTRRAPGLGREDHRSRARAEAGPDRKSTRLNSSHTVISYAVFCLKKKNAKAGTIFIPGKLKGAPSERTLRSTRNHQAAQQS